MMNPACGENWYVCYTDLYMKTQWTVSNINQIKSHRISVRVPTNIGFVLAFMNSANERIGTKIEY